MRAIWSLLAALLAATLVAQPADYTLDTGDVISVVVLRHGQFSGEYTVPPDGNVVFPGVGSLQVRGLTLQRLADTLRERLSQRLRNPEVFVSLQAGAPATGVRGGSTESPWRTPNPTWLACSRRDCRSRRLENPPRAHCGDPHSRRADDAHRPACHLASRRPAHELPAAAWRPAERAAEACRPRRYPRRSETPWQLRPGRRHRA
jgi:hypothetical protein